ncbi:MAG: peptidase M14 [Bacteroidetes bacterium]|nr:MAG: peptidase M14 [Bacteroidota bacterium]
MVILLAPIYNADGNERVSLYNRPRQNGPYAGMGQRPNAQGLDLNRDHMKVKSPEARSFIRMMKEYDPYVLMDLHTTNGSQHAYHLTYSPPLNPNTEAGIDSFLREELLPAVTDQIRSTHGWEYYFYGNFPFRSGSEPGWYTFDHRPRFNNNYIGLRNRMAILSEAYAYATFRDRVMGTKYFVEEILEFSFKNTERIIALVDEADRTSIVGDELAVAAEPKRSDNKVSILMGRTINKKNPFSGELIRERIDFAEVQEMYEYGSFTATETSRVPSSYFFSQDTYGLTDYLDIHGVKYTELAATQTRMVEGFRIDSTKVAETPFQQINERKLYGTWIQEEREFEAGTIEIKMGQPLSRLAFYLLDPRSDDGLLNWAGLDRALNGALDGTGTYPIYRSVD